MCPLVLNQTIYTRNSFLAFFTVWFLFGQMAMASIPGSENTSLNTIPLADQSERIAGSVKHAKSPHFSLVDVSKLSADNPTKAIKDFYLRKSDCTLACDILIVGGGLGGVSAAIKLAQLEKSEKHKSHSPLRIVLTEETDWLGGQMTTQGVAALDENRYVETSGAPRNYQNLRNAIRNYYRRDLSPNAPLPPHRALKSQINPGNCWVSRLSFEPKVALDQIDRLIAESAKDTSLVVQYRLKPFMVKGKFRQLRRETDTDHAIDSLTLSKLTSVYFLDLDTGKILTVRPKLCLDATECGDLLPLSKVPYSSGSDSRSVTGEPHAPERGDPNNVQDFTYPFVVELKKDPSDKIAKPARYDEFNGAGKFSFDGFKMFESVRTPDGFEMLPFWQYRRLIDRNNFTSKTYANDLAMINWESNDVRGLNLIDQSVEDEASHLASGKLISLGFLYWLQNDCPRDDGGKGYPELMFHKDVLGTPDGLAKYPYIRESRRAKTKYTIVEEDVVASYNHGSRAHGFNDSVGIGLYPVDIHGKQEIRGVGQSTKPFQIPLGSLIPRYDSNLLPACKNIGTTHITNGAYRLHPIEWSVGEAQGALAFLALKTRIPPEAIYGDIKLVRLLQKYLVESGAPIYWFDDIPVEHQAFAAIQFLAVADIMPGLRKNLHFSPDQPITRTEAAQAIAKTIMQSPLAQSELANRNDISDLAECSEGLSSIEVCLSKSIMKLDSDRRFRPNDQLTSREFREMKQHKLLTSLENKSETETPPEPSKASSTFVSRAQFAKWLYQVASSKRYLGSR